jgi:hypothetical protein
MPFLVIATLLSPFITTSSVLAQSETPKIEVGAQYTLLRLAARQPGDPNLSLLAGPSTVNDSGFGGRMTFNMNRYLSVEGEVNFFPEERTNFAEPFYINSRRTQGLFGVKAGARTDRFGVFAKARPGFMHFGEGTADPRIQTLVAIPFTASSTEFALDLGGVVEVYASRRLALRFDLGDTMIRYGDNALGGGPSQNTHNFQFTTGVGWRF